MRYIPLPMNIVWISPECIFKGMTEQGAIRENGFPALGKKRRNDSFRFSPYTYK